MDWYDGGGVSEIGNEADWHDEGCGEREEEKKRTVVRHRVPRGEVEPRHARLGPRRDRVRLVRVHCDVVARVDVAQRPV